MAKLHAYLVQFNPDLLLELQQDFKVSDYLSDKVSTVHTLLHELMETGHPDYIIEEQCMDALTEDLKPSRYHYLQQLTEEEFPLEWSSWNRSGVTVYELCNLVTHCMELFDLYEFSEDNEDDRELYYTITGAVSNYLELAGQEETV